jgi:HK97 family phage portal protein
MSPQDQITFMSTAGQQHRASAENPSTPLSQADEWLYDAWGASPAPSGVRVNTKTALTLDAVYRAVDLISGAVAKVPLNVYRQANGGWVDAPEHPASWLLRDQANENTTAYELKRTLTINLLLAGNGYAVIDRDGDFRPTGLLQVAPEYLYPVKVNGRLFYVLDMPDMDMVRMNPADVVHVRGPGWSGLEGWSVIQLARNSLGLGLAQAEYSSRFYAGSARQSVVLEHPGRLGDGVAKRLREQWEKMVSGLSNSHRTAVLEEGMTAKPLTISARDSQLIEARGFSVREVANWFGLPPHKLGDPTRTSHSSLEQENQAFLDDSLDGRMAPWEHETRAKLLTEQQRRTRSHTIEFHRQSLVKADLAQRNSSYQIALGGAGYLTINEVRRAENRPPLADPAADQVLVPLNVAPLGSATGGTDDVAGDNVAGDRGATGNDHAPRPLGWLAADVLRCCRRLAKAAERAAKRPDVFVPFVDGMHQEHRSHLIEYLEPAAAFLNLDPKQAADTIMSEARTALLTAAEVPAGDLPDSVFGAMTAWCDAYPGRLAHHLLELNG